MRLANNYFFDLQLINFSTKSSVFFLILIVFISCQNSDTASKSVDVENDTSQVKNEKVALLNDTSVHFLWRENVYDDGIKDSINTIILNESYIKKIPDSHKAAIGYIATFIGNECWWDGAMNEDRSNLKCQILTALDLGYQCSDRHIDFIKKWFSNDDKVLEEIEQCPLIPYTATIQNTFDIIDIIQKKDTLELSFAVTQMNMRESVITSYTEKDIFKIHQNEVFLISKEMSEFEKDQMTIGEK